MKSHLILVLLLCSYLMSKGQISIDSSTISVYNKSYKNESYIINEPGPYAYVPKAVLLHRYVWEAVVFNDSFSDREVYARNIDLLSNLIESNFAIEQYQLSVSDIDIIEKRIKDELQYKVYSLYKRPKRLKYKQLYNEIRIYSAYKYVLTGAVIVKVIFISRESFEKIKYIEQVGLYFDKFSYLIMVHDLYNENPKCE